MSKEPDADVWAEIEEIDDQLVDVGLRVSVLIDETTAHEYVLRNLLRALQDTGRFNSLQFIGRLLEAVGQSPAAQVPSGLREWLGRAHQELATAPGSDGSAVVPPRLLH